MVGLLVVTHGMLAEELVSAARKVLGDIPRIEAESIDWDTDPDVAREAIEGHIRELDEGDGVLVLTDMFGGTPTNLALSMLEPGKVEIVTGVNLPMVIKFGNLRDEASLDDVATKIATQGRESIHAASDLMAPGDPEDPPR